MAQLIEVQHMRGASGGKKFHALLKAGSEPQPPGNTVLFLLSKSIVFIN